MHHPPVYTAQDICAYCKNRLSIAKEHFCGLANRRILYRPIETPVGLPPVINCPTVPLTALKFQELIDKGAFGAVYKTAYQQKLSAFKTLHPASSSAQAFNRLAHETRMLSVLQNNNIIKLEGIVVEHGILQGFLLEFMPKSLFTYLEDRKQLDPESVQNILKEVISALMYLNSRRIVHRDIKSENILLDAHGRCKLTDFETARVLPEGDDKLVLSEWVGTLLYNSPETLSAEVIGYPAELNLHAYSLASDLYSLAVMTYEMLSGIPWEEASGMAISCREACIEKQQAQQAVFFRRTIALQGWRPKIPNIIPKDLQEIIKEGWAQDPQKRLRVFLKVVPQPFLAFSESSGSYDSPPSSPPSASVIVSSESNASPFSSPPKASANVSPQGRGSGISYFAKKAYALNSDLIHLVSERMPTEQTLRDLLNKKLFPLIEKLKLHCEGIDQKKNLAVIFEMYHLILCPPHQYITPYSNPNQARLKLAGQLSNKWRAFSQL